MQKKPFDHLTKEKFIHLVDDKDLKELIKEFKADDEMADSFTLTQEALEDFFESFDADGNEEIDWEEFKKGLSEIRRGLMPKHIYELRGEACRALDTVTANPQMLIRQKGAPSKEADEMLMKVEKKMDVLEHTVRDFDLTLKKFIEDAH